MRTLALRAAAGVVLAAAVLVTLVAPSRAQMPDWNKISFKTTRLAPNLHLIEGVGGFAGGNIAVAIAPDGVLIVDTSMAPLSDKLRAAVKTLSDKPIKMIVNTHAHGDHTSGNMALGKDAVVVAHQRTRERLLKDGFHDFGTAPPEALPDITIDEQARIYWGDEELRVAAAPAAHTDTDVTVRFVKQNVVHLGDLYFNGMYPFIDTDHGGTVKGYVAAVAKALRELPADAKIIPGHGPLATRKDLEAYLAMLEDTTGVVEKGLAAGKSLDDLTKAKPFAKYDAKWGQGFLSSDAFVAALYEALKKK